jgi:hypothetical protein
MLDVIIASATGIRLAIISFLHSFQNMVVDHVTSKSLFVADHGTRRSNGSLGDR